MKIAQTHVLSEVLHQIAVDDRFITWLWLYLKKTTSDIGEHKSSGMENQMAIFFLKNPKLVQQLIFKKNQSLLSDDDLQWITENERQTKFINNKLFEEHNAPILTHLKSLSSREYTIAVIDAWDVGIEHKYYSIKNIEKSWIKIKQNDHIFSWFHGVDEDKKLFAAWKAIAKAHPRTTVETEPFNTTQSLLFFFDKVNLSLEEKTALIAAIKRSWVQKKSSEKKSKNK